MSESLGYPDGGDPLLPSEEVAAEQEAIAAAYSAFFSSPHGMVILLDLQREAGHFQPTFVPNDPHHSAFREGRRSLYLYMLTRASKDDFELIEAARNRALRRTP